MVRGPGFEPGLSAWKADVLVQARLAPLIIIALCMAFRICYGFSFLLFLFVV